MNKIKVIDLLIMISIGVAIPQKIKYGSHILEWFAFEYRANNELDKPLFSELTGFDKNILNDEIEIIGNKYVIPNSKENMNER